MQTHVSGHCRPTEDFLVAVFGETYLVVTCIMTIHTNNTIKLASDEIRVVVYSCVANAVQFYSGLFFYHNTIFFNNAEF